MIQAAYINGVTGRVYQWSFKTEKKMKNGKDDEKRKEDRIKENM